MEQALHILKDKDDETATLRNRIHNVTIRHQKAMQLVAKLQKELSDERLMCKEKEERIRELERAIAASFIETNKVSYDEMRGFKL